MSRENRNGRKRRYEDERRSDRNAAKRRRSERGEGRGNTTRPITLKELKNICTDSVPENAILGLANKGENFEALLASEEIAPVSLKLVISAFRLLCSAKKLIAENAEKLLRSPIAKKFMTGTVLSSFINEMPHSDDWKDENERVCVMSDLTEVFGAFLQRFGKDIVHKLPLPQLSASMNELKKRDLIKDADYLDQKLEQMEQLKNEVIRRAKSAHSQQLQVEPPQSFRELSVIPQAEDLNSAPFLRENITNGRFRDLDHYLDVQFRLLREDFVKPLRDGIQQLLKESNAQKPPHERIRKRAKDVSVYHDVTIQYPVCSSKSRVYRIRFDASHHEVERVNWERSKRLKYGTLVCLSADNFNTLVFATVENRDPEGLKVGELDIRFENVDREEINQFVEKKEIFVMIESPAYFEAYRHVLEALKEIQPEELPFQGQIVECCRDVGPPEYQIKKENSNEFAFDFTGVLVTKRLANPECCASPKPLDSPSTAKIVQKDSSSKENQSEYNKNQDSVAGVNVLLENEVPCTAVAKQEYTPNVHSWPDRESLGLNESQMRAFKTALTKKFAVIQGPPGTGKTYVGWKIARVLLQTASLWEDEEERTPILMVSYTNHALDQFLEGLLPVTKDIVRVGGRSRNEKLKIFSLKDLQKTMRWNKEIPEQIYTARMQTKRNTERQKESSERSLRILSTLRTSVVSMKVLGHADYSLRAHSSQLREQAGEGSIDEALLNWLKIERQSKRKGEVYYFGDLEEAEYGFGYGLTFDNKPFDDKDLDQTVGASHQVAALLVKEADHPRHVRRNLTNEELMTEDEEMHVDDIYGLKTEDRWGLYRLWRHRAEVYHHRLLLDKQGEYEQAIEREQEIIRVEEYDVLRKARVIGMTTTCAARYRRILKEIRPKIVLVEEAAEVFEGHIITSLTQGCQHLILIGDHQQLRPNPAVYELAKKYKLDVSLFERMVNVGIQCERLNVQHRMRPEIAALMKHIYNDLQNHESVEKYEDIRGMKKNMFFISHNKLETSCDQSHSHVNEHEAKFLVALCRYSLQQGYRADQITLLTTYMGQMFAIRDCLKTVDDESIRDVRLTTVDNFQGEENDIILLSLVRSNKDEKVGFIKTINRACVALSRARVGFYCIGNFALLSKHSEIWNKIVADLKRSRSIGKGLPLVCQNHNDEISVETAEDFNVKVPNGGCQRPCGVRLKCGHVCTQSCHPYDTQHKEYCCGKRCEKKLAGCDHVCPKLCWEVCEQHCGIMVTKTLPGCGHTTLVRCDTSPLMVRCKERCEKALPCGHVCQGYCGDTCTEKCQELVKRTDWPCGHDVTIACSATPADCAVRCEAVLECGDPCSGTCGECRMGRIHKRCEQLCRRLLVCSHECKLSCKMPCPPCTMKCENRCVHSECRERCGDPCVPCREECSWVCPHYTCSKKCGELCDRPRCNEPCDRRLSCGHLCRGLKCEKPCICVECLENENPDAIAKFGVEDDDDEDARFIKLPDCEHIYEVNALDSYMDTSSDDNDRHVIQFKRCISCQIPICTSLRYGNVIKQQLLDIEKVKTKLLGNNTEVAKKIARLYTRVHTLLTSIFDGKSRRRSMEAVLEKQRGKILKIKSELQAAIIENKLTLIERLFAAKKKKNSVLSKVSPQVSTENNLGQQFNEELIYLKKRLTSEGVTQRELQDINTEFSRFNLQLELCLLSHDIKSLALELNETSSQMLTAVQKEMSSGKRIADDDLDKMMNNLATIRRTCPGLNQLTSEEKKQIVAAIGLTKGHWFKCPEGHYYVITECGGAMERSTCPDCRAVIGGENHRLDEGNQLAPEMDGARYPAWSEQANLANYGNLQDIR